MTPGKRGELGVTFDNYSFGRATAVWCDCDGSLRELARTWSPAGTSVESEEREKHGQPGRTGCLTASPLREAETHG
jgi:hypothetical protein